MVSPLFPEPALIVDKTESFSVTEGDLAALECTVSGTPELKPKWFKNGVELSTGRKYRITFAKMISSLNILTSERDDTGEYMFEVKNEVGSDVSKMHLTVLGLLIFPRLCQVIKCQIPSAPCSIQCVFLYR